MNLYRIVFTPIGLLLGYDVLNNSRRLSELNDNEHKKICTQFISKAKNPLAKPSLLTVVGFISAIFGTLLSMVSEKAGRKFGTLLTLIGLGGIVGGFYKASELNEENSKPNNNETPTINPPKHDEVPQPPAAGKTGKKKKTAEEDNDLSKLTVDELIAIVKNEVEDKDYKSPERIKAAKIIAGKKLEEIQEATKQLVEWLKNNLNTPRIKGVVDAVRSLLHNIGDRALSVILEPTSSITKLAKNILDEIEKVIKIKHHKSTT